MDVQVEMEYQYVDMSLGLASTSAVAWAVVSVVVVNPKIPIAISNSFYDVFEPLFAPIKAQRHVDILILHYDIDIMSRF